MTSPTAEHLIARSLTIVDDSGQPRLVLSSTDSPDRSTIAIFGPQRGVIEIAAESDGSLHVGLRTSDGASTVAFGVHVDGRPGISVMDHASGSRTTIGTSVAGQPPEITVHYHGKLHWSSADIASKAPAERDSI